MDKHHQDGWKGFINLCHQATDDKTLPAVFELMFTAEEKDDLSMRYLIIKELLQEKRTQRDIASHLNVSIAKITRGSNELKRTKPSFIHYLKNLFIK